MSDLRKKLRPLVKEMAAEIQEKRRAAIAADFEEECMNTLLSGIGGTASSAFEGFLTGSALGGPLGGLAGAGISGATAQNRAKTKLENLRYKYLYEV